MKIFIKNHLSVINNLTFLICKSIFWFSTGVGGHGEVACYI